MTLRQSPLRQARGEGLPASSDFPAAIDFEVLALFLEARRIHRRMTPRRLARAAGVEVDDLRRAVNGRNPGEDAFLALCDWMGEPAATFVKTERVHG